MTFMFPRNQKLDESSDPSYRGTAVPEGRAAAAADVKDLPTEDLPATCVYSLFVRRTLVLAKC